MDFYSYYIERFGWGNNPYTAIEECQRIVTEMLVNPNIPFRIATSAAADFMAALVDYAGNGCMVSKTYGDVRLAFNETLDIQQTAVEAIEWEWNQEEKAVEIHPDDIPLDDPGYGVEPVDEAGADPNEEWSDSDAVYTAINELYGTGGEAGTTGTRRPFPDWEHADKWTQIDWAKLQNYKGKVLAAAGHNFLTMRFATDTLAAAEGALQILPLPRQVELVAWAEEIADGLLKGIEKNLRDMCARSLHSHARRLVQKQMLNVTDRCPENDPK